MEEEQRNEEAREKGGVDELKSDEELDRSNNDDTPLSDAAPYLSSSPAAATAGLIKLTLRGSQTDVLPLLVRPTMKISSLLKQYCKAFNVDLAKKAGIWIEFDGERLDNAIGIGEVEDFEDEEVLDVRGAR